MGTQAFTKMSNTVAFGINNNSWKVFETVGKIMEKINGT